MPGRTAVPARHRAWSVGVAAVVVLVIGALRGAAPLDSAAAGAAQPAEYQVLATAARETLTARAVALVEGATPPAHVPLAAGNVARSARFAAAEETALRGLAARRDQLRARGEVFVAAEVWLTDVRAQRTEPPDGQPPAEGLRLTVVEHTVLYRKRIRGDEPESTAYAATRAFDFTLTGGRWTVTDAVLLDPGVPPITEPDTAVADTTITPGGGMAEFD